MLSIEKMNYYERVIVCTKQFHIYPNQISYQSRKPKQTINANKVGGVSNGVHTVTC